MPDFVVTEAAQADLEQIDEYIAADIQLRLMRFLNDLDAAMQRAADAPADHAGSA